MNSELQSAIIGMVLPSLVLLVGWLMRKLWIGHSIRSNAASDAERAQVGGILSSLDKSITQLTNERDSEKRKASEYLETIKVAQKERDGWMKYYHEYVSSHDRAVELLMAERGKNWSIIRRAGQVPFVDPIIARLVSSIGAMPHVGADIVEIDGRSKKDSMPTPGP